MHPKPNLLAVWIVRLALLVLVGCSYLEPEVTWATVEGEWDGWKKDVVKMRAARKNQPVFGALYSEPVQWDQYYDMEGYKLMDGRYISLNADSALSEKVSSWEKGRKVFLCYDDKTGAFLIDSSTSLKVPLAVVSSPHPIDGYIKSLNANTTYDMMSAGYEEERLWCLEIDRIVRAVLQQRYLPADVRREFIELTEDRVNYCRRQSRMGGVAAHAAFPGGTIAGPAGSSYGTSVYRSVYFHLADISGALMNFSRPPSPEEDR
jgi:hypothetical protein